MTSRFLRQLLGLRSRLLVCLSVMLCSVAHAQIDPLFETLNISGRAGLGFAVRSFDSPYRGVGSDVDLMPIYVYEGDRFFLHSYRAGARFDVADASRLEISIMQRFEGFPNTNIPASLAGMDTRHSQLDGGLALRVGAPDRAQFVVEVRHDISEESNGGEIRLGGGKAFRSGPLVLYPYASLSWRDEDLNNYYYGVKESEQTPERPAYEAGAGFEFSIGLYGKYHLTEHWRLLAGIGTERLSREIRDSPIVSESWLISGYVGAAYDFDDEPTLWASGKPILIRVFHGASSDCNLNAIIRLTCVSIDTTDNSRITGVHFGRTFMENVNDWPLDFIGYIGPLYRNDREFQEPSWQLDAYMKALWHRFPWSESLRTRIGFGAGISFASRVPYVEQRDQQERERNTSKLLNYLDPSIDINVGDLFGAGALKDTWFGFGVSHRSGAFASSSLLGNVDGGSNYIYTFLEMAI